jgi:hypothetical protein
MISIQNPEIALPVLRFSEELPKKARQPGSFRTLTVPEASPIIRDAELEHLDGSQRHSAPATLSFQQSEILNRTADSRSNALAIDLSTNKPTNLSIL